MVCRIVCVRMAEESSTKPNSVLINGLSQRDLDGRNSCSDLASGLCEIIYRLGITESNSSRPPLI